MLQIKNSKKKYKRIETLKIGMSQIFGEDARVIPFTGLKLKKKENLDLFVACEINTQLSLVGKSKGRGFAGVMKRWNFSGGPKTHGQSDRHRAPGSIGSQGQGRVIPGKKMPGRYGGDKKTVVAKFIGVDHSAHVVKVKGCVPGNRNSEVIIYVPVKTENES